MRRILPFSVILIFALSACARPGNSSGSTGFSDFGDTSNSTGRSSPTSHKAYISGGDSRVGSTAVPVMPSQPNAQQNNTTTTPAPAPVQPAEIPDQTNPETPDSDTGAQAPAPPVPVVDNSLKGRIREFELSRFDKGSTAFRRVGSDSITIKIFFADNSTLNFEKMKMTQDPVTKTFTFRGEVHNSTGDYTLTAKSLDDISEKNSSEAYKSKGEFDLVDTKKNESAKIWYNAYKARLKVTESQMTPVKSGSYADTSLKTLQNDTFGWVHNWAVDDGVAFYLVDVIRRLHSNQPQPLDPNTLVMPVFAFKGESVKTDKGPSAAQSLTEGYSNVQTVGNSKNEGLHLITAEVDDPQTKDKTNFMLDVVEYNPSAPVVADDDTVSDDYQPIVTPTPPAPHGNSGGQPQKPAPVKGKPSPPKIGSSYLPIDMSMARAAVLDRDVMNNAGIQEVNDLMKPNSAKLNNFFWYAAPFKDFIEKVSKGFQAPAAFVYPAVVESAYFQGPYTAKAGDYSKKKHMFLAYGPFQIHPENVKGLQMTLDERNYFAPAACGAARLMNENIDVFLKAHADTTFALMAFNSGGPVAKNLALQYRKKYSYLARASAGMDQNYIDYANNAIAIYVMARDLTSHGFNPGKYTNTHVPTNKSVNPPHPIANATCRQIVESAGLSGY